MGNTDPRLEVWNTVVSYDLQYMSLLAWKVEISGFQIGAAGAWSSGPASIHKPDVIITVSVANHLINYIEKTTIPP